jgi:hypothetical protein
VTGRENFLGVRKKFLQAGRKKKERENGVLRV